MGNGAARAFSAASCASCAGRASGRRSTICSRMPIRRRRSPERVAWLIELLRWVRVHRPPAAANEGRATGGEASRATSRAKDVALRDPVCACGSRACGSCCNSSTGIRSGSRRLRRTLRSVLRDSHGLRLFATTGLPQEYGFWGEAGAAHRRASLLPEPPRVRRSRAGVRRALPGPRRRDDAACVAGGDACARCGALFHFDEAPDEACWAVVRRDHRRRRGRARERRWRRSASPTRSAARASPVALARSPFVALGPAAEAYLDDGRRRTPSAPSRAPRARGWPRQSTRLPRARSTT